LFDRALASKKLPALQVISSRFLAFFEKEKSFEVCPNLKGSLFDFNFLTLTSFFSAIASFSTKRSLRFVPQPAVAID